MHLEVVICTHNRSNLLRKTLLSIAKTSPPKSSTLDITIIANSCNDNTQEMVGQLKESITYPIRVINERKTGKSHALNTAINNSVGSHQIFIDDDHRLKSDFFEKVEALIEDNPEYSIFCGRIIPDWDGSEPIWIHNKRYPIYPLPIPHYDLGSMSKEVTEQQRLPGGGNLIVKKAVLSTTGFFNPSLGPSGHNLGGGEDGEYVHRSLRNGFRILYCPHVIQYHWVDSQRLTLSYLLKKSFLRSQSATYINLCTPQPPPLFLFKKLFLHLLNLLFPYPTARARFYLMRSASTAGEITAYITRYLFKENKNK